MSGNLVPENPVNVDWTSWSMYVLKTLESVLKGQTDLSREISELRGIQTEIKVLLEGPESLPSQGLVNRLVDIEKKLDDITAFRNKLLGGALVLGVIGSGLYQLILVLIKSIIK